MGINQEVDAKAGDDEGAGGKSSASSLETSEQLDMEHFDPDTENIIDTVEEVGGIDASTGGAGDKPEASSGDDDKGSKGEGGSDDDAGKEGDKASEASASEDKEEKVPPEFHKHPAWQRILRERNEAIATAENLTKQGVQTSKTLASDKKAGSDKIIDISTLSNNDLIDWQNDDPKGYAENLRRYATQDAVAAVRADLDKEQRETKIASSYDSYNDENPANDDGTGLVQMWDSGQIQTYMDKNPGHNTMSAHTALTIDARIKQAEEAAAKTKEEMIKRQKARIVTDLVRTKPPVYTYKTPFFVSTGFFIKIPGGYLG